MPLTPWMVSLALGSTGTLPTFEGTELGDVVADSELAFTATVHQCRKVVWNGPVGGAPLRRCLLQVDEELKGHIETGWVEMPLERDDANLEAGAEVLVLAHTAKVSCRVAACVDNPAYATLPAFSDAVVMTVGGSVVIHNDETASTVRRRTPTWMDGLDWSATLDAVRDRMNPEADAPPVVLPGAPAPQQRPPAER